MNKFWYYSFEINFLQNQNIFGKIDSILFNLTAPPLPHSLYTKLVEKNHFAVFMHAIEQHRIVSVRRVQLGVSII